jgi:dynein heavy chain
MKTPVDIHWLRINAQPVKITLVNFAREWEKKYSEFVKTFTETRITALVEFIQKLKTGLGPGRPCLIAAENAEKMVYGNRQTQRQ